MSDKDERKKSEASDAAPTAPAKKGLPVKLIGSVAALMVVEAVGVFFFVSAMSHQPQAAEATQVAQGEDMEASVEVPLLEDKFQNMQTGRVWVWDTSIVLKVRARNQEGVKKELDRRKAEVAEGIAMIFRKAPHSQLKEAGLEAVNRQVTAYLNQVAGKDTEGRDRIERVVIPRCKGFPAD
jgi:flagellar basal body-associated protein FliL